MSKYAQIFCALLSLVLVDPAAAEPDEIRVCFDLASNPEQRDCVRDLYRAASAELERVFRDKVDHASKPPEEGIRFGANDPMTVVAALNKSQNAWQAYRDAECWGVVGSGGGTGSPTWGYVCLVEKTKERIRELTVPIEKGR